VFRRLFLHKLVAAHRAGELQFFGNHTSLAERNRFLHSWRRCASLVTFETSWCAGTAP
jgi:hypothetical protein